MALFGEISATQPGGYFSLIKVAIVAAAFFLWLAVAVWVNHDARRVKTARDQWNLIVFAGGAAGILAWLFLPFGGWALFPLGALVWALLALGTAFTYVLHRNTRVHPSRRVLTRQHLWSLLGGTALQARRVESLEKVRLSGANGDVIRIPEDPDEQERFGAAQKLLADSLIRRATDVDLTVTPERSKLLYRIDGVVTERDNLLTREQAAMALTFLKQAAGLQVEERRRPQEGRLSIIYPIGTNRRTQVTVRTSGSTAGERLYMKVVAEEARMRLPDLGFAPQRLEMYEQIVREPSGLVIHSGPPGSGVSTTQYATLMAHDAFMTNIHTLERQPLMELENITQHVHDSQNPDLGFARQLQSILRREPDVVMVGDCPDHETAELATRAAANGRKIYLAITARDCFEAIAKYLKLLEDNRAAAAVLKAVVNQRLVRKLCEKCKQPYRPDPELLRKANLPADRIEHFYRPPEVKYDRRGREIHCGHCQGTGYYGRTGVFELLVVNDEIRNLIRTGARMNEIRAAARKNRMLFLQEEGLLKVIDGITSMNEVLRVLRNGDNRG